MVRITPISQEASPARTGCSPQSVSETPPQGQDTSRKLLGIRRFSAANWNLLNHESFRCEQRRFYKVILENKRVIELAIDRSHTARPKACARVDDAQVAAIGGLESHTGHTLFAEMQFEEGLPPTCGLNCRDDFQRSSAEPLKPPEALAQWSILRINRGGEMLCNKLGIHDAANLTKAQYRVTSEKITQATTLRVVLGAQGYRQLSAHIIQYLYDWTGETGSTHTFRPGTFSARAIRPSRSRTALRDFCRQGPLEGTDLEIFADRVAEQLVELNSIQFFPRTSSLQPSRFGSSPWRALRAT